MLPWSLRIRSVLSLESGEKQNSERCQRRPYQEITSGTSFFWNCPEIWLAKNKRTGNLTSCCSLCWFYCLLFPFFSVFSSNFGYNLLFTVLKDVMWYFWSHANSWRSEVEAKTYQQVIERWVSVHFSSVWFWHETILILSESSDQPHV